MERSDKRHLFSRFTRALGSRFRGEDPKEVAATVIQNTFLLEDNSVDLWEIAQIRAAILLNEQPTSSIGSAQDIDTTIRLIEARVRDGVITPDIASKYLGILSEQRALSLRKRSQPGQGLGDQIARALSTRVSRRGLVATVMAGLTTTAIGTLLVTPSVNSNELLDSRPKAYLTERFSDLSKAGWRVRHAPGSIAQEYTSDRGSVNALENGFNFFFGDSLLDVVFRNDIAIRAVKAPDGAVSPFLRVTPAKGSPADYVMETAPLANGGLITKPVIFENPTRGIRRTAQFQTLGSGEDFTFLGTYLPEQLSLKK